MPFYLVNGDLVSMNVDAIVNAANVSLKMVEGVGRAIFHNAGDLEMTNACKAIGRCEVGQVVETPSFKILNTKSIFHAVAPIYINGKHNEYNLLEDAYNNCLNLAISKNYTSSFLILQNPKVFISSYIETPAGKNIRPCTTSSQPYPLTTIL